MDNSENQFHTDFRLRKGEIIRGDNAYSKILQSSICISANFIKAFISKEEIPIDFTSSPLFTNNVKVGFIIARKKIPNAVSRNRVKRLLKESYRLNKNLFKISLINLDVIFTLTESGYKYFLRNPNTRYRCIEDEMKTLSEKIKKYFSKQ